MDRLRTLLLSRTSTVVLDPELVANAATRPARDADLERFEDELAQLGFTMSLDLAMTLRRLPNQAIQDLKAWVLATLAAAVGAHRPHVPLFRNFPSGVPKDTGALYLRRVLSWLSTRADQPCPWCGQIKTVGALDPCGHLVCRQCWDGGNYAGCPICHRRVALGDPFVQPSGEAERVRHETGQLRLVNLAFDAIGVARERFERLLARATPLPKADREEVETVIDVIGPKAAIWLPSAITVRETMAIAIARLWKVSPDRVVMVKATQSHLRTATDVLRIAAVLVGADPALASRPPSARMTSIGRALRRAILQALDKLPVAQMLEDVGRHPGWWKRLGEVVHPFELAAHYPNAALAFAAVRETDLATTTFAAALRTHASDAQIAITRDRVRIPRWAHGVEVALRDGDVRAAVAHLAQRPGELLRRVDHVVRVTCARQPEAFADVMAAIRTAIPRGAPNTLLALGAHVRARAQPWPRRVMFPRGEVLKAWGMPDARPPLRGDAIGMIDAAVRGELVARAEQRRQFARAVIDRGLADLLVPIGERSASVSRVAWPRGSEAPLPEADRVRLFLHWEEPLQTRVDLDLSVAFYDAAWRMVALCDFTNLVVGEHAAVHSGDLTNAPAPLGATELVDLDLGALAQLGIRHAVMTVLSYNNVAFDKLTHGFAGVMEQPPEGAFDARAVLQRFDLAGDSKITIPLTIDLETRRLRWVDVHVKSRGAMHAVGGYRAALAHVGRDFADLVATRARPTMWDLAAIHAASRANVVYIRERDGSITTIRRREGESSLTRLARVYDNPEPDSQLSRIPHADAPTWLAVLRDDLAIPRGSAGYVLDARGAGATPETFTRLAAGDLVAELARRS